MVSSFGITNILSVSFDTDMIPKTYSVPLEDFVRYPTKLQVHELRRSSERPRIPICVSYRVTLTRKMTRKFLRVIKFDAQMVFLHLRVILRVIVKR